MYFLNSQISFVIFYCSILELYIKKKIVRSKIQSYYYKDSYKIFLKKCLEDYSILLKI